jgi:hypothetical protein
MAGALPFIAVAKKGLGESPRRAGQAGGLSD